jgi:hypothetical protein
MSSGLAEQVLLKSFNKILEFAESNTLQTFQALHIMAIVMALSSLST